MNTSSISLFTHHIKRLTIFVNNVKPLCTISCYNKHLFCKKKHSLKINNKDSLCFEADLKLRTFLQVHANAYRTYSRRPIKVIECEEEKKMFQDYTRQSMAQSAEVTNDEVISERIPQKEHLAKRNEKMKEESVITQKIKSPSHKTHKHKEDIDDEDAKERNVLTNLNIKLYKNANKNKFLLEYGKSSKLRRNHDVFLVEGWRLLVDGLMAGLEPMSIFFSRSSLFLKMIPSVANTEEDMANLLNLYPLYRTPYSVFELWSGLTTPPGIIAAFPLSAAERLAATPKPCSFPLTVVLDKVRDPNNMGSILRTLAAAGVHKTILMTGCCNIWNAKVIRSASGAHFHMHYVTNVHWSNVESHLSSSSSSVYLADACREISHEEKVIETEDENVGLYQKMKDYAQLESINHTSYGVDGDGNKTTHNDSFNDFNHVSTFKNVSLPQVHYNALNLFEKCPKGNLSNVLILGGETGLSNSAKKFAIEAGGSELGIPMLNEVESLNSAVATGIIVYEMLGQYKSLV